MSPVPGKPGIGTGVTFRVTAGIATALATNANPDRAAKTRQIHTVGLLAAVIYARLHLNPQAIVRNIPSGID
jgi:hypothetical protein